MKDLAWFGGSYAQYVTSRRLAEQSECPDSVRVVGNPEVMLKWV